MKSIPFVYSVLIAHPEVTVCTYGVEVFEGFLSAFARWNVMSAVKVENIDVVVTPTYVTFVLKNIAKPLNPHLLSHRSWNTHLT